MAPRARRAVPLPLVVVLAVATVASCGTPSSSSRVTTTVTRSPGVQPNVTAAPPSTSPASSSPGVATTTLTFVDVSRGTVARPPIAASTQRVLTTTVLHPSTGTGPWPLVVFGHGFALSADAYSGLLGSIARAGFVVAAPEFPDSSRTLPGTPDENDLVEEPCDMRFVAQQVQTASAGTGALAGLVQPGPVALAGQSDGATAAAFATLVPKTCAAPFIISVVAYSAAPVPEKAIDETVRSTGPALLAITGTADTVNPATNTDSLYSEWPGSAWLLTSQGDDHLGPSTTSPRFAAITNVVVDFLRATMKSDSAAAEAMGKDAKVPGLTIADR